MRLSEWYKAGNHLPNMAKGGKAKKSTRRVSDDPIGDFLNDYEMEKLTKGIAELDAKIKDLEPVPTQVETGSDPMLLDVYPRLKREMEADPHLYEYGTANKKDPSFRRPMLRKPAGRPDDVIPDRLDNDWLEYQLRPRGQTDFSDKLPPGMELPIGKVRSLLEDPSEYYAKGGVSLKNIESQEGLAPYGLRHSGEGAKGKGYFGGMSGKHGMVTELSAESEGIGEHPLIVPTLTREELEHLLAGGDPTESIYNKARQHAEGRKSKGKEAFAGPSELRYPMPEYAKGGEVSGPKGFGLADVAPFVSPMNMKTGGQARTRAGTIAKPTFIDEQLGRTSERLSKLATDPEQAMRDIAAQYFPSPTESPEEQQRKLEELALGFTGNIKPVGGLKQMGGLQFDPRFDPRAKEQERLKSLVTKVVPTGPKKVPEVSLVDYEGRPFITSMSDRIAGGGQLQAINDVNLVHPVDLLGGQDYMFNNKGKVWASAASPVTQIMRNASLMKQETGQNPIFLPWRMAPTGGDFAHMTGETMLSYANSAMDKTGKKLIDKEMKEFIPSWKGINSPESINQFRNASDKTRKAIKNMLDVNFRESGGLGIGEARLSVADPKQLLAPDTGIMNVGEIFAGNPVISESGHFSYPKAIPGRGLGRLKEKRSIYELLPAAAKARGIQDPTMPSQTDIRALQMKPYAGIIDDKLLKLLGY